MASLPRLVANAPLSASVVRNHFLRSKGKGTSILARGMPGAARARWQAVARARGRRDIEATIAAASGQTADAYRTLSFAVEAAIGKQDWSVLSRLAETAATLHQVDLAQRALAALPEHLRSPAVSALVAAEQGHMSQAIGLLAGVSGATARSLRSRLIGETEILRAAGLAHTRRSSGSSQSQPSAVLHVVSNALPEQQSGYTIRTHGIVREQRNSGLDAQVVTRLGFPVDIAKVRAGLLAEVDGVPYHHLLPRKALPVPSLARQNLAVSELASLARRLGSPLLHAHSKHENGQVAIRAGAELGVPVVYEARGFLEETWRTSGGDADSDFYRWSKEAETQVMLRSNMVVTLAECMRADIIARGVEPDRVVVVPNAVPDSFTAELPSGAPVRATLGISDEAMVFGTVTTLNAYEGLDTVIQAMRLLDDPNIYFMVVGDGPARHEWEASSADLPNVIFVGRVPHTQVREYLAAFDMFVAPRRRTPVTLLVPPLKPLEAMAGGVPVLASDLPPLVEIVRPGDLGEAAVADDSMEWAQKMSWLSYARGHVQNLGERSREFVEQERTWASLMPRYLEIYRDARR